MVQVPPAARLPAWPREYETSCYFESLGQTRFLGRIASAWTTTDSANSDFTVEIDFEDEKAHEIAFYCVDWMGTGNVVQRVEVFRAGDTSFSNPLDTREVQLPSNGVYFVWMLSGHNIIRIFKLHAPIDSKAMVSAVFFGGQ